MSFGLPPVKPKPELSQGMGFNIENCGIPNLMLEGFSSAKSSVDVPHPLAASEKNHLKNRDRLNLVILRNTQGLHAPLRLGMEFKAAKQIGRLPFLQSSNVMLDSLTGRDLEIGPEDVFNTAEFTEVAGQPHAVVERSLGLL